MFVTLENTKSWLRVESNDEDLLIESLIITAENIVEDILRFSLINYQGNIPEPVKQAIYFAVSRLYEERNEIDPNDLIESLKTLLSAYREAKW